MCSVHSFLVVLQFLGSSICLFLVRYFDAVCWIFSSGYMMCGWRKVDVLVWNVLFEDY